EIEALAKLDWPTAKPLLEKIVASGGSVSYPMALSQLYAGAVKENDTAQADIYRAILKQTVVEDGISGGSRRTVLQSLLKDEWLGQEEWFISLFGDPNLSRPGRSGMSVSGGVLTVSADVRFSRDTHSRRASGNSLMRDLYRSIS